MEVNINIEQLRNRKIFVATPMYGGMCCGEYANSCISTTAKACHMGLDVRFAHIHNESLITRARNYLADSFLRSDCTHLMFIDADISFAPEDVFSLAMLAEPGSDKEVVCAPYPKKAISWDTVRDAALRGVGGGDPNELEAHSSSFVFNRIAGEGRGFARGDGKNEAVEVLEGGTGFMMIQRSALEKYRAAYPEFMYLPDHVGIEHFDGSREIMAFFDCVIDKDTRRYLSEDYMFCQWVRRAGVKIWMCPWIRLGHIGTYKFHGSMPEAQQMRGQAAAPVRRSGTQAPSAPYGSQMPELRFK